MVEAGRRPCLARNAVFGCLRFGGGFWQQVPEILNAIKCQKAPLWYLVVGNILESPNVSLHLGQKVTTWEPRRYSRQTRGPITFVCSRAIRIELAQRAGSCSLACKKHRQRIDTMTIQIKGPCIRTLLKEVRDHTQGP